MGFLGCQAPGLFKLFFAHALAAGQEETFPRGLLGGTRDAAAQLTLGDVGNAGHQLQVQRLVVAWVSELGKGLPLDFQSPGKRRLPSRKRGTDLDAESRLLRHVCHGLHRLHHHRRRYHHHR